jgi:hypothetical protein
MRPALRCGAHPSAAHATTPPNLNAPPIRIAPPTRCARPPRPACCWPGRRPPIADRTPPHPSHHVAAPRPMMALCCTLVCNRLARCATRAPHGGIILGLRAAQPSLGRLYDIGRT